MRVYVKTSGEAQAIPLYDGGILLSHMADAASVYAARARAEALIVAVTEAGVAVTKAGGEISGLPDLTDPVERQGVWDALFALSLAEILVTGWTGLEDEEGVEFKFEPKNIVHVLRDPVVADIYVDRVMAAYRIRESEKNG